MTSLKWGRGVGGSNLTYRLAALGLDYSFGDECMFLKKDNDRQCLYFSYVQYLYDDDERCMMKA